MYISGCRFCRFVEWEDFADHAMVHNPKGGTAVLPKMITEKAKVDDMMGKRKEDGGLSPMRRNEKNQK